MNISEGLDEMGAEQLSLFLILIIFGLHLSVSFLHEILCCHVTVFTVCWQKCCYQRPISWILSQQAEDSPPNL